MALQDTVEVLMIAASFWLAVFSMVRPRAEETLLEHNSEPATYGTITALSLPLITVSSLKPFGLGGLAGSTDFGHMLNLPAVQFTKQTFRPPKVKYPHVANILCLNMASPP